MQPPAGEKNSAGEVSLPSTGNPGLGPSTLGTPVPVVFSSNPEASPESSVPLIPTTVGFGYVPLKSPPGVVALVTTLPEELGNVCVVLSVPASVKELFAVSVLPFAIVNVALEAG